MHHHWLVHLQQEIIPETLQKSLWSQQPCCLSSSCAVSPPWEPGSATQRHEFFKDLICFLFRWSVTSSHHNATLTGLSSDLEPQVLSQTVTHPSGELKRSELLIELRASSIPSASPSQSFPKSFTVLQLHHLSRVSAPEQAFSTP